MTAADPLAVHRDSVLLTPSALAALLGLRGHAPREVLLLDATVRLARPERDGDYRSESGEAEWARAHIPGSRHVDLRTRFTDSGAAYHFGHPAREATRAELAALGATPDTVVVLYDQGALQWATRLWWTLRDAGVPALILDGGLPAWRAAGLPVVTGPAPTPEPHTPTREFTAARDGDGARPSHWASLDEVRALSEGRREGTLLCALGVDQFEGTAYTRYARRGRIPGSRSLPAHPVLEANGTVRPTAELAAYTARSVPVDLNAPLVLYCGGGISATLVALAFTLAGRPDVRVYDGSLEEWTADPHLPVLTGPDAPRL
ncbi:sulfurtransferase [Streptomyces sp. MBT97]|uniref:sulfurtransferase n=1 Tax=Streptomyces sp. MBT97 TaxID=2800411 RepID=UPI0019099B17|nr:rhodanese-like domain-containing protein [Streptomyces sp. MBT97]MBK3635156.1 sulfurtransferase [Streptomyces sp. MBT97]